jgi:hypothetical protein
MSYGEKRLNYLTPAAESPRKGRVPPCRRVEEVAEHCDDKHEIVVTFNM